VAKEIIGEIKREGISNMTRRPNRPFKDSNAQPFKVISFLIFSFVELLNPLNLERASAQTPFYKGKTITLVVTSAASGGYDLWARLTARHIGKHIPGNPSIVVQNMPGAGNIIGANYVYGIAKADGLTLGAVNPALYFDQLVGRSEVKFDWAKFNWIGSPEKNDIVYYMRADQPLKSVEDLRNTKEPAKCGSTGTGSTGHYIPRLLEETSALNHIVSVIRRR
jgi:tripartite-type tricarboxylate transporter receptor subunit TctC